MTPTQIARRMDRDAIGPVLRPPPARFARYRTAILASVIIIGALGALTLPVYGYAAFKLVALLP